MFTKLKSIILHSAEDELHESINKFTTSCEYLQVSIDNKDYDNIQKWLKICSKDASKLSTSMKLLSLCMVKEW